MVLLALFDLLFDSLSASRRLVDARFSQCEPVLSGARAGKRVFGADDAAVDPDHHGLGDLGQLVPGGIAARGW